MVVKIEGVFNIAGSSNNFKIFGKINVNIRLILKTSGILQSLSVSLQKLKVQELQIIKQPIFYYLFQQLKIQKSGEVE